MMVMDSALVILMGEALVVLMVLGLTVFFVGRHRRAKEVAEIETFIDRLDEEEAIKSKLLETILTENCGIDSESSAVTLKEVGEAERALLQRIIQLYLERKPSLLTEIDQLITNLSDPYCKLLAENSGRGAFSRVASDSEAEAGTETKKIGGLERVNQQLVRQLDTAMKTIDEITAEYTRVFSGNQTALELENSSKKMQQIFLDVERNIKGDMADLES